MLLSISFEGGTLSGIIVEANDQTGLANKVFRLMIGGSLK